MTTKSIAQTVHPGGGAPAEERRQQITSWLTANGIDPGLVAADDPIIVLTVPFRSEGDGEGPWLIQVVVLTQLYAQPDGTCELNLLTRKPVTFQRTVPLTVPFPADPTTDAEGSRHGEEPQVEAVEEGQRPPEHQGWPEADEQQELRPAVEEEVQGGRSGACQERVGEGESARIEQGKEASSSRGDEAVPEPEEDRRPPRKEEVTP